ncbi:hypothetical protein [Microvirga puerhi]|nr:hypothetical protein [Microvirga puerhi]
MVHHHSSRPRIIQKRHIHIASAIALILMILALILYGYQFWWSE